MIKVKDMNIKNFIIIIIVAINGVSCMNYKAMQRKLNVTPVDIYYVHDGKVLETVKTAEYNLEVVDSTIDNQISFVTKKRNSFMFLILWNVYDYEYQVNLGKNLIRPGITEFLSNSIKTESERFGQFSLNSKKKENVPTLRVVINELKSEVLCAESGFSGFGLSSRITEVSPSKGVLNLSVELVDVDGSVLYSSEINSSVKIKPITFERLTGSKRRKSTHIHLAESLAECVKEVSETLVKRMNGLLDRRGMSSLR